MHHLCRRVMVTLGVIACGACGDTSANSPTPSSTPTAVPTSLSFSGTLAGDFQSDSTPVGSGGCGMEALNPTTWHSEAVGQLNGSTWFVSLFDVAYKGPGTYTLPTSYYFSGDIGGWTGPWSGAPAANLSDQWVLIGGTFTVGSDSQSGSVDAGLAKADDAKGTIVSHLKGTWSCNSSPASPTASFSIPGV